MCADAKQWLTDRKIAFTFRDKQIESKRCSLASLTVTVITKNEAHNIEACLRSVSFADQLLVCSIAIG